MAKERKPPPLHSPGVVRVLELHVHAPYARDRVECLCISVWLKREEEEAIAGVVHGGETLHGPLCSAGMECAVASPGGASGCGRCTCSTRRGL
jgi:hypothetical protein